MADETSGRESRIGGGAGRGGPGRGGDFDRGGDRDRGDRGDRGGDRGGKRFAGVGRGRGSAEIDFDYKNNILLRGFTTETGKILPARMGRLTAKQQRNLAVAIKRARHLALIPYCDQHD